MYVVKRHIKSGRYVLGKIILINPDPQTLIIDIVDCNDYGYSQRSMGKYEGCACIYTFFSNGYEMIYANNYAEILAKVL